MPEVLENQFSKFLQHLAESLDISEMRYKQAEERYQAVGNWLGRDESIVAKFAPEIYPQGSFRLGTVIKPISEKEEYDIDLVCELALSKNQLSQKQLKDSAGYEIKGYARANNMKSPAGQGRRCWTLNYADGAQFHMDILPALPDGGSFRILLESRGFSGDEGTDSAIAITDNTLPNYDTIDTDWPRSNPKGYAEWFKEQMRAQFYARRMLLAESIKASVEEVPDYKVKTPLQRVVQILKRHRDIMFSEDQEDKPISIIINTLTAHAYENEADLLDALVNVVNKMPNFILQRDGVAWVPNPVNPLENFAHKWSEHPKREQKFRLWLQQIRTDISAALQGGNIRDIGESLKTRFGDRPINEALHHFPLGSGSGKIGGLVVSGTRLPSRFNVAHRQKPLWPVQRQYSVEVYGRIKCNGQWHAFSSDSQPLPKRCDLLFSARTTIPRPFDVYWQVVNTGDEAKQCNQLRRNRGRS